MTATATRLLAAAAWLAAAVTLALPAIRSDARFNSRQHEQGQRGRGRQRRRTTCGCTRSRPTPPGLTGYAIKKNSSPRVPAATGASDTLAVALGGYKNQNATAITRVLTLQALSPLPAGASPLTVTASLAADPVTGRQPLSAVSFSDTTASSAGATATLTAGAKRSSTCASGPSRTASSRATTCCTRRR